MRQIQTRPDPLQSEFLDLKSDLIGNGLFINPKPEDSEKWARYNQLVQFFHFGN